MTSHYATLGIEPTATAAEIKAAWRKKCTEHHPDREGGDPEEMAKVNAAYEALRSPQSRLQHDRTADETAALRREHRARSMLADLIAAALERPNPVAAAHSTLQVVQATLQSEVMNCGQKIRTLKKRRERFKVKEGENIAHLLIDGQIKAAEDAISRARESMDVNKRVLELLNNYEYEEDEVPPTRTATAFRDLPAFIPLMF